LDRKVRERSDFARNVSLHLGDADAAELPRAVRKALEPRPVPSAPLRAAQRVAMKLGRLDWEHAWLERLIDARRSVLGDAASGPPRFLVRVDEFPYYTSFDQPQDLEMSRRFHEVMADAGLVHLISALPQLTHAPLEVGSSGGRPLGEQEIALFERMRRDGVTFAQHGTTHRTRFDDPRRRSELCGLEPQALDALLEDGRRRLLAAGVGETRVFVPPFNRFDAAQYPLLAERFDVICGGPESVALIGFHGGPLWRDGAVYLPAYAPLYADARTILPAAERLIALAPGTWIPIVLHTSWEQDDDFRSLRLLAERIAPYAVSWEDLLADLQRSAMHADAVQPPA
jgi:peptidoglycan/xylan/chitin deacetylase (PgdA/CDA1 family)